MKNMMTKYILLTEKTPNYTDLMRLTDSMLPVVLFFLVVILDKIIFNASSNKINKDI